MPADIMFLQTDTAQVRPTAGRERVSEDTVHYCRSIRMIEEAGKTNLENYIALGKFFRAYHLTQMTMTFGDISL